MQIFVLDFSFPDFFLAFKFFSDFFLDFFPHFFSNFSPTFFSTFFTADHVNQRLIHG